MGNEQVASERLMAHPDIRIGGKTFAVTVVAVYLAMFAFTWHAFTPAEVIRMIAAGGIYLLAGFLGVELYARTNAPLALAAFYAVEISLGGLIVYWTGGFFLAGLIMLPLASLSVQVLPRRWVTAVCTLLIITLSISYGLQAGWEAALSAGIGYLAGILFVVFATQTAVRERNARAKAEQLTAKLEAANQQLRQHAIQVEELAITRERARLAHEIHDSVGHILTALDVQMELLVRLPPDQTKQRQQIAEQARVLVKKGVTDMRRAVQALRPVALEAFSLPDAIAALVADFKQTTPIHTSWQIEGNAAPLPPRLTLPLYRTAQEALTNVLRHAPAAQQVTIRLHYGPETVTLMVKNDGITLPPLPSARGKEANGGYGLSGLRERAALLGGTFHAGTDKTGIFQIEMNLPMT